jgi:glycosyltransferase involved in cell wall biosynthesis
MFKENIMKLSILICSLKCREHLLKRLLANLEPQKTDDVEILINTDNGEATIGAKRNRLLKEATGDYICFVDDDDVVADTYVAELLEAMRTGPDCIGFKTERVMDGRYSGYAIHSIRFSENRHHTIRSGSGLEILEYHRCPNHLNPIKATIAKQVRFNEGMNTGEDCDYAERCKPLLKTEAFIDRILYHYLYVNMAARKNERINRDAPR